MVLLELIWSCGLRLWPVLGVPCNSAWKVWSSEATAGPITLEQQRFTKTSHVAVKHRGLAILGLLLP